MEKKTITFFISIMFFMLNYSIANSEELTLSWFSNNEPDLGGYRIYYGTSPGNYTSMVDVGHNTTYTVKGLNEETHYLALSAYDIYENESGLSGEVAATPKESSGGEAYSGGGGCFIATAAYGSYFDPHVHLLRDFRDNFLLTNYVGKKFVALYYRYSPPIANHISKSEHLKSVVRIGLIPLLLFSKLMLSTSQLEKLLFLVLLLTLLTLLSYRTIKIRKEAKLCK